MSRAELRILEEISGGVSDGGRSGGWNLDRGRRYVGDGAGSGSLPTALLGHLLEGPALGYSLGAEVQQRFGSAPAAHCPGPGVALLRSRGAVPAPLGRGGVHPAWPGPGRDLCVGGGRSDAYSASPAPATPARLPVLRPRSAAPVLAPHPPPGRRGDAAPLRPFTTMKLPRPPLYPRPSSRPHRPSPLAPLRPPRPSSAIGCTARSVSKFLLFTRCMHCLSFRDYSIRAFSEQRCQSRDTGDQSQWEETTGAGLKRSFGAGPGFIHNIPPPPH